MAKTNNYVRRCNCKFYSCCGNIYFNGFVYGSADIDAKSVVGGYEISNPVLNEIGLETGDKIVSINGEEIEFVSEIRPKLIKLRLLKLNVMVI